MGPGLASRSVVALQGFLLSDEDLNVLAQGSLIAFQRQDVIGIFAR